MDVRGPAHSAAPLAPATAAPSGAPRRWRWRQLALARLYGAALMRTWPLRVPRLLADAVALAVAAMLTLGDDIAAARLFVDTVTVLTWTGAAIAIATAFDLRGAAAQAGVEELGRERGLGGRQWAAAWTATFAAVGRGLVVPTLGLAALQGILAPAGELRARALLGLWAAGYSLVAWLTLSMLSRWSAMVSPRRGRWLCLAVLAVPELLPREALAMPGPWSLLAELRPSLDAIAGAAP